MNRQKADANMETLEYLRFLLALVVVVGLIAGAAWAARRFGLAPRVSGQGGGRLGVVAVQSIDTRRKLVLVRRDDREHLIIVSPTAETVIETGIVTQSGSDA
jgi:flagellar protein FliO/FliZ